MCDPPRLGIKNPCRADYQQQQQQLLCSPPLPHSRLNPRSSWEAPHRSSVMLLWSLHAGATHLDFASSSLTGPDRTSRGCRASGESWTFCKCTSSVLEITTQTLSFCIAAFAFVFSYKSSGVANGPPLADPLSSSVLGGIYLSYSHHPDYSIGFCFVQLGSSWWGWTSRTPGPPGSPRTAWCHGIPRSQGGICEHWHI